MRLVKVTGVPSDLDRAREVIGAYLPSCYVVVGVGMVGGAPFVLIGGDDVAGWTLDGYVAPRLASGLYRVEEMEVKVR